MNDPHENATWVYNYDRGDNILSKVKYAYTTGTLGTAVETIPYTYGDSNWKDKLTAYNGTAITYDAIGNPLNDGNWTYEWAVGRQLKEMSKPGKEIEFKYDFNGLRTQKIVTENGVTTTTNYLLHGKLVTHMTVGNDKLHFFYDNSSRPAKVDFNGTIYTYLHNLQGDIVGILDNASNLVVEYKYDAWGRSISIAGSLADTLGKHNPFRYRGYVFDEESGLYYLCSRYYDCTKGRFVNSDIYCGAVGELYSHSSYTYCNNAPIVRHDSSGYSSGLYFDYELVAYLGPWGILALAAYWATVSASNAMTYRPRRSYTETETNQNVSSGFGGAKRKSGTATSLVTRGAGTGRDKPQSVASEIGRIASRFGILKCIEAADAITDYLLETDRHGYAIRIQYPCGPHYPGFIVSDIYNGEMISTNGVHKGVLYEGNVYCNVHPYGLPEAEWLADFHGFPEYMKKVTYIPF